MPPRLQRIGLFGGTFDPPHLGHLAIAERAWSRLRLDRVIFMPCGTPPHKRGRRISPAAARIAMTRRAVRGRPGFVVSMLEARRRGASYTADTLRALVAKHPRARFYLVIGEDSLDDFSTWRDPEAILGMATLAVAPRPRGSARRAVPRNLRTPPVTWLRGPRLPASSSEVRARLRAGRPVDDLVPAGVLAYISRHRLYRSAP